MNKNKHDLKVFVNNKKKKRKKRKKEGKKESLFCLNKASLKDPEIFSMKGYTAFHSGLDNQPGNLILIRKYIVLHQ